MLQEVFLEHCNQFIHFSDSQPEPDHQPATFLLMKQTVEIIASRQYYIDSFYGLWNKDFLEKAFSVCYNI